MNRRALIVGGAIVAVIAAVLLVARPWESDGDTSGSPDFGSAELIAQDSDNQRRPATAEELTKAFPLPIQLPQRVPDGYALAMVTHFEPPPGLDRLSFANNLRTQYRGPGTAGFGLEQRPGFDVGLTDAGVESLSVRNVEAHYLVVDRGAGAQMLTWARCGRVFMITSSPRDALSKDELLRVAESIGPEACEPGSEDRGGAGGAR